MALSTFGAVFGGFRIFVKNFVIRFFYVEKMVRSECLSLVKHIYLIQTIILIRLLWVPAISKICISFADKKNLSSQHTKISAKRSASF